MKITSIIGLLMLVALVATGCAKSTAQLQGMTDDELGAELFRAKFATVGFGAYDKRVRAEMLQRHSEWPSHIKNAIEAGQIKVGMTKKQVAASWGAPTNIHETLHAGGKAVVWKYGTSGLTDPFLTTSASAGRTHFVFFDEKEVVVAIQN